MAIAEDLQQDKMTLYLQVRALRGLRGHKGRGMAIAEDLEQDKMTSTCR